MNEHIKKIGIKFGFILAFLLALPTLIAYTISSDILLTWWTFIYVFLAVIVCGLLVIGFSKKALQGLISFKSAFTAFFIMLIIGSSISIAVSILVFNFVAPELKQEVKQKNITIVENRKEMVMASKDLSKEQIDIASAQFDDSLKNIKESDPHSIGNQTQGLFVFTAFFSVFGLLLAAMLKSREPIKP